MYFNVPWCDDFQTTTTWQYFKDNNNSFSKAGVSNTQAAYGSQDGPMQPADIKK